MGSICESRLYDTTCFLLGASSLFQHFSLVTTSLRAGFQVYLSKCWDPYVSPGCTIRLAFFWVLLLCFSILILSLPLLGLGSKSTSLSPGFCVRRPRQYDTICWELDLISGFFVFFLVDGLGGWNQQMWLVSCRRQGMLTQGPAPDPKCKLIISSFLTLPHLLDCLNFTRNAMPIVLSLQILGGWNRWGVVDLY